MEKITKHFKIDILNERLGGKFPTGMKDIYLKIDVLLKTK